MSSRRSVPAQRALIRHVPARSPRSTTTVNRWRDAWLPDAGVRKPLQVPTIDVDCAAPIGPARTSAAAAATHATEHGYADATHDAIVLATVATKR